MDIRSDVYALRFILYELLTGTLPYDLGRKPLPEAVGAIREEEPAPLSSIDRHYRGDIDTIAAKALEKDKTRRYGSAAAADIRRYLADEPIVARRASASYQLRKFARRHKALVAGTAMVFVVLAAGLVASPLEAARARKAERGALEQRDRAAAAERRATAQEESARMERDRVIAAESRAQQERNAALSEKQRADTEAATAQAVDDFLQNDLVAQAGASHRATPETNPDPDLKVRMALDRAAARIEGKFEGKPEVEAAIRDTIGRAYIDLDLIPGLRSNSSERWNCGAACSDRTTPRFSRPWTTLQTRSIGLHRAGQVRARRALFSRAREISARVLGPEHNDTLAAAGGLAHVYWRQGRYLPAEALFSQVVDIRHRVLGPEHPSTLSAMGNLAAVYEEHGKYAQAETLSNLVLEVRRPCVAPSIGNRDRDEQLGRTLPCRGEVRTGRGALQSGHGYQAPGGRS